MTTLQIIGALMIMAFFVAVFLVIGVIERSWKVPAAVFGITFAVAAFSLFASALLTGVIA